jgi:hypothetical protein
MSTPDRLPKLGDIVLYHESVRQDVWDPPQNVTWPAIVTDVIRPHPGQTTPQVRLTAFRPFDKPIWDITASYSPKPEPGHWSWPEPTGP